MKACISQDSAGQDSEIHAGQRPPFKPTVVNLAASAVKTSLAVNPAAAAVASPSPSANSVPPITSASSPAFVQLNAQPRKPNPSLVVSTPSSAAHKAPLATPARIVSFSSPNQASISTQSTFSDSKAPQEAQPLLSSSDCAKPTILQPRQLSTQSQQAKSLSSQSQSSNASTSVSVPSLINPMQASKSGSQINQPSDLGESSASQTKRSQLGSHAQPARVVAFVQTANAVASSSEQLLVSQPSTPRRKPPQTSSIKSTISQNTANTQDAVRRLRSKEPLQPSPVFKVPQATNNLLPAQKKVEPPPLPTKTSTTPPMQEIQESSRIVSSSFPPHLANLNNSASTMPPPLPSQSSRSVPFAPLPQPRPPIRAALTQSARSSFNAHDAQSPLQSLRSQPPLQPLSHDGRRSPVSQSPTQGRSSLSSQSHPQIQLPRRPLADCREQTQGVARGLAPQFRPQFPPVGMRQPVPPSGPVDQDWSQDYDRPDRRVGDKHYGNGQADAWPEKRSKLTDRYDSVSSDDCWHNSSNEGWQQGAPSHRKELEWQEHFQQEQERLRRQTEELRHLQEEQARREQEAAARRQEEELQLKKQAEQLRRAQAEQVRLEEQLRRQQEELKKQQQELLKLQQEEELKRHKEERRLQELRALLEEQKKHEAQLRKDQMEFRRAQLEFRKEQEEWMRTKERTEAESMQRQQREQRDRAREHQRERDQGRRDDAQRRRNDHEKGEFRGSRGLDRSKDIELPHETHTSSADMISSQMYQGKTQIMSSQIPETASPSLSVSNPYMFSYEPQRSQNTSGLDYNAQYSNGQNPYLSVQQGNQYAFDPFQDDESTRAPNVQQQEAHPEYQPEVQHEYQPQPRIQPTLQTYRPPQSFPQSDLQAYQPPSMPLNHARWPPVHQPPAYSW